MVRAWLFVVALVVAPACRTLQPIVPLPPDDPRPAALLAAWAEVARDRHALRGVARLAVDGADGEVRIRGKQVIALERPARLRVEVLGFLNQTLAVITTDGETFEIFRAGDRSYETGRVHPDLLWQEAHLALTPAEAVEVLLGAPALTPDLVPARAVDVGGGVIWIDLVDAADRVSRRAAFDAESRLREFEVLDDAGAVRWRAQFADYARVDGSDFAYSIVLDVHIGAAHVEISLRDVDLNPQLPPNIFHLRTPTPLGAAEGDGG